MEINDIFRIEYASLDSKRDPGWIHCGIIPSKTELKKLNLFPYQRKMLNRFYAYLVEKILEKQK